MNKRNYSLSRQVLISILLVSLVALACFYTSGFIGYRVVALILLMVVSFVAMVFEIIPVLITAIISAIVWNFFFIPPIYTFHIYNAEDVLMFLLYFIIALVNAVLTIKIRKTEKKLRDKEEKEKTIKLYNNLLNSLSHELRTPISTILGAVDTLQENKDKLSTANETELLSQIDEASIRLNRQVENLLNMSRLESGMLKLKTDWCDINELIYSVITKDLHNQNHQIVFHPDEHLPLFKVDVGLMQQVIYNLLHNAIQYTPEQSVIHITATNTNDGCMITVADNGPGFPETEMGHAFDKFYRLPHSKTGGSGLGLSIAKGFVEAHNGTITLKNATTGGAVFTVEIPAESSYINSLKNE